MSMVYKHELDKNERVGSYNYIRRRIKKLEGKRELIALELRALGVLAEIASTSLCKTCHGAAKYRVYTAQDDGYWANCDTCGGSGYAAS